MTASISATPIRFLNGYLSNSIVISIIMIFIYPMCRLIVINMCEYDYDKTVP